MGITITKEFDGNEIIREGRNGRIYTSVVGWRWIVAKDGRVMQDFDRRRDAVEYVRTNDECPQCSRIGLGPLCKAHRYDPQPCAICLRSGRYTECTTHPDAANPLTYCGDCGQVACPDHRVEDDADRCVDCAATFYAAAGRFHCPNIVHSGTSVCGLPTDHPSGYCDICRKALLAELREAR